MHRAQKYSVTLDNWLSDVVHIWKRVPALSNYFFTVSTHIIQHKAHDYTVASVASDINRQWELEKQRDNVKVSKPKTTRSAFTTQEATGTGDDANKPAAAEPNKSTEKTKKKKTNGKRKRGNENLLSSASNVAAAATTTSSASLSNLAKKPRRHCTACGVDSHNFSKCYLVIEEPGKDFVNRETFDNNMKVPFF